MCPVVKVMLRGLWTDADDAVMAASVKGQGGRVNIAARELLWWVLFEGAGGTWHYMDNERKRVLSVGFACARDGRARALRVS